MNNVTKEKLQEFIDQICILSQGVVRETGINDSTNLINAAIELKDALNLDETIT